MNSYLLLCKRELFEMGSTPIEKNLLLQEQILFYKNWPHPNWGWRQKIINSPESIYILTSWYCLLQVFCQWLSYYYLGCN